MKNLICPVVDDKITQLYQEIQHDYPQQCERAGFTPEMCARWVGSYNDTYDKPLDFLPDKKSLVQDVETKRNKDGKSFLYTPYSVTYNLPGQKQQTYTIIGSNIYNKEGKVVYPDDSNHRRRIFANLAVQQGRAVVVTYKDRQYVVNNKDVIMSASGKNPGNIMQWGEENGDRKMILTDAHRQFVAKQQAATTTTNSSAENTVKRTIQFYGMQLNGLVSYLLPQTNGEILNTNYWKQLQEVGKQLQKATTIEEAKDIFNSALKAPSQNIQDMVNIFFAGNHEGTWTPKREEDAWKQIEAIIPSNTISTPANFSSQIIAHLKSIGINVFNRAQMEKYLNDHPNILIQQAIKEQQEMADIKAKAIADGTFMKAPNGNPTNLTERQWLQVRTKNFINWFGDCINDPANASKVVDENGEPLIVYHYSDNENLTKFSTDFDNYFSQSGGTKKAIFFTEDNPNEEERGSNFLTKRKNKIAAFLNIKDLKTYKGTKKDLHKQGTSYREVVNKSAEDNDVDGGVHMEDFDDNKKEHQSIWIIHNPNQVKSATDNNGDFSTLNDDIQMAIDNKNQNNSLYIIDEAIRTNNWNDDSIDELDNLNNEDYGKILKRFSQEELEGSDEILKQAETIIARGGRSSDSSNSSVSRERTEQQEQQIESWAKENGLWYNDYQESKDGSLESVIESDGGVFSDKSGSESLVYWMNDGTTVKAVDASHYGGDVQGLLDKVMLHNSMFPETSYKVLGFGRDRSGTFRIIIKQQIVKGSRPTTDEILKFIKDLGIEKKGGWYYTKDGKRLTDLNYSNIIKVGEDTFAVIDCDIEFTQEYLNGIKDYTQLFITSQGEIYGFVDKEGNMYLDETIIDASHPIHEYTHLWDRAIAKNNPQLWKKGISLMQEGVPALWNEIANSENYGKLWQSKGVKGDKLINLIASEVHARLVGDNGAKLLDQIAKEKGKEGIIGKLKQWILDAWKNLKATFSNWSQEEIDKLTLKDFNHMTVRDFANSINPNVIQQQPTQQSPVSSSLSPATSISGVSSNGLSATSVKFGEAPSAEVQAEAQRKYEEKNAPTPEIPRPKSAAYESALTVNDSKYARFKRTFSPQQIKDRGAMISGIFSRLIDEYWADAIDSCRATIDDSTASEEEKDDAKETLYKLLDPVKGRQYVVEEKKIDVLLREVKDEIQRDLDSATEEKKVLWQNTLDYFEELFNTQATLDIEEREGIRIVDLEIKEQTVDEDESDESNDGDEDVGNIATGSDGWNYKVRYEDPFSSLSKKVRGMLYDIERPDSEKDDLGNTRNYSMGQIYASLLSYLSANMQNPDDFLQVYHNYDEIPEDMNSHNYADEDDFDTMYPNGFPVFPVLEQMKSMYPWVGQVIQRLTDDYLSPEWNTNLRYPSTGGAMASQFYTTFRKPFIPYGKVQIGENKFGITPLNYQMEDRVQLDKLQANYNNRMILSPYSLYNADGKINRDNARHIYTEIDPILEKCALFYDDEYRNANPEEFDKFIAKVSTIVRSFGIDATQDTISAYLLRKENGEDLYKILSDLQEVARKVFKVSDDKVDTFNYMVDVKNSYGRNMWAHFFDGRGIITDASYMQSFYDSASHKTKYSYSADNYLMKKFRGICMGTQAQRRAYIDKNFGKYEWFKNQRTGEWRNKWLEFWYNYEPEVKEIPYRNIDNITEYGKDGEVTIRPYMKWEPGDILEVQNRSYAPEKYDKKTAYYLAPIFSDSPMSMTVLGPRMSMEELLYGYVDDNNVRHRGAFLELINQEMVRIQLVQQREEKIKNGELKEIANFDGKRGKQFCFMPELNTYTFEATDRYPKQTFLERMVALKEDVKSGKATMMDIERHQIQAVTEIMSRKMQEYEGKVDEEQYYNMTYGNISIIQMTTVDLAFYKNNTDFQKRFKEVYAGGIELNTNSKYGMKYENVLLIADDIITSPSYTNIAAIIDGNDNLTQKEKDDIKETFMNINVADAQAIRSMYSFRSVLDMMGKWDDRMEQALNNFKNGVWDKKDFNVIYQTIKPFAYSVIERNSGNGDTILVPQQHKNSEICALMMYDLIANGLNDSPVYKAVSRFMDETLGSDGKPLIHMIQYESAGKVGNQGVINISINPNKVVEFLDNDITVGDKELEFTTYWDADKGQYLPNDLEHAEKNFQEIKKRADYYLNKGEITQKQYKNLIQYLRPTEDEIIDMLSQAALVTNPDGTKDINTEVVHTMPFENYYQQQPTPEHHVDAESMIGSQSRNVVIADLPEDFTLTLKGKGSRTYKGRDAVIDFLYELMNENLLEDFFGKGTKTGLKGLFESKKSLGEAVKDIVRGNPKYGSEFAEALTIDEETGNFVLSPNSPTIFPLMQEIITSFFKNRITKQKMNGAALIQAAGTGLDDNLRLEFDDKGNCIGAHCLMPLTSKKLFEPLLETQVINGKEVKVFNVEVLKKAGLDKAVGYRIPTENKSSMMPLIIDGFTPLQNGSAIVLPAEITNIAGSDFDVDKMYVLLTSFYIQEYNMEKAQEAYEHETAQKVINAMGKANIADIDMDEIEDENFKEWFDKNKDSFKLKKPRVHAIKYDFSKSPKENGRKARNNMILQIMYNILTSKEGSQAVMNPQGFPDVEHASKVAHILTDEKLKEQLISNVTNIPGVVPSEDAIVQEFLRVIKERYPYKYEEYAKAFRNATPEMMQRVREEYIKAVTAGNKQSIVDLITGASTDELKQFIDEYSSPESPIYPQTFIHSHAKNMAGMLQIGIYAIQGSMAEKYQRANVLLKQEQQFTVNDKTVSQIDISEGGRRVKNVNQMVGASADNGKNPNLTDMGSTTKTAPIIGYMLRAGLSHLEAALIINQPYMMLSGYKSGASSKTRGFFYKLLGKNPLTVEAKVTTDMLIRSLLSPYEITQEEDMAIAALCFRILCQHEAQEYLTRVSRADSPNGALKHSYAKARVQRYNVDLLQAKMSQPDFPFFRIRETLSNDTIDTTASEDVVREQLKGQKMGLLYGMYSLGIQSFHNLVSPYFFGEQEWFDNNVVKPILYNLGEKLSDEQKENVVENIYKSYITYFLSSSPLFGDEEVDGKKTTLKEKREFYLKSFPTEYQKILQENEDIRTSLGSILQVNQFGDRKRIVLQDVGSLSKGQKKDIQRRFEDLAYSDNEVARKLIADLLIYSYFDNGLQFTHDSFSSMFTTGLLINFKPYTEALNDLDKEIPAEDTENFIRQFLATFPRTAVSVDSIIKRHEKNVTVEEGAYITMHLSSDLSLMKAMTNVAMSNDVQSEGANFYPYIMYNESVYVLDKDALDVNPSELTYIKLPSYSTFPRLPLFNRNMSVAQMANEFPLIESSQQSQEQPDNNLEDAPMSHNEGSGNPEIKPNSMFEEFEGMDDFIPDFDPGDLDSIEEVNPSDTYKSEGEQEMQKPFCGVR